MRRIVVISVVVLAALACGVGVALAASGGKSTPISKAQAEAFAHAVNLRTSDLPGGKGSEVPPTELARDGTQVRWAQTVRCARHNIAVHRPLDVRASDAILLDGLWIVDDAVRVMPSESVAASEVGAFASKRGHVCFARADQVTATSANEPPENREPLKTTFLQLGRSLGVGAMGVQTVSNPPPNLTTKSTAVLYSDAVLFRVGPAEIEFDAVGPQAFPAATERRLLSLLHSRAEAHKL